MIKDLFGILVYVNVNVINHLMLENIEIDYENFSCRKRLIDRLNEKCSEDINRNEMVYNVTLHDHRKVCHSFTIYIVKYTLLYTIYISHCYFNNHRH